MVTKEQLVQTIALRLKTSAPKMSTGSTEPREIFDLVNEILGLGLDHQQTKPELAKSIVEAAGFPWLPGYESRGGTVTREGLTAVLRAVDLFLDAS